MPHRAIVNEQRVQDTATRHKLHAFFQSLPAGRFPALAALGEHSKHPEDVGERPHDREPR